MLLSISVAQHDVQNVDKLHADNYSQFRKVQKVHLRIAASSFDTPLTRPWCRVFVLSVELLCKLIIVYPCWLLISKEKTRNGGI
ncbi:hypothetical protein HNR38_001663 [Marinobacter oulmenensis]|uniref:Uncharacterized protein n=1 Tax=Marinobacter oulmenensis TaxID=643747 RepID=A0A840U624_9GAMM|nr:hypothetical protein [Marinobacter oulmenensis]